MKAKDNPKVIIGIVILAGLLILVSGRFQFSIVTEINNNGLLDGAQIKPWPSAFPVTALGSGRCSDTYGSMVVVFADPTDAQWQAYKSAGGIDLNRSSAVFIDGNGQRRDVLRLREQRFEGTQTDRLTFSSGDHRGVVIAPETFIHRTAGQNELQTCSYDYTIYFMQPSAAASCGDGICQANESASTCAADCTNANPGQGNQMALIVLILIALVAGLGYIAWRMK